MSKIKDFSFSISPYPVDGYQLGISVWNGKHWQTVFDKRVISDTCKACDITSAIWQVFANKSDDEIERLVQLALTRFNDGAGCLCEEWD